MEIRRFPKDESKKVKPVAEMGPDSKFHVEEGQVPEKAELTQHYSSSADDKPDMAERMANGGKLEMESGMEPGANNHTVGHLGTHRI